MMLAEEFDESGSEMEQLDAASEPRAELGPLDPQVEQWQSLVTEAALAGTQLPDGRYQNVWNLPDGRAMIFEAPDVDATDQALPRVMVIEPNASGEFDDRLSIQYLMQPDGSVRREYAPLINDVSAGREGPAPALDLPAEQKLSADELSQASGLDRDAETVTPQELAGLNDAIEASDPRNAERAARLDTKQAIINLCLELTDTGTGDWKASRFASPDLRFVVLIDPPTQEHPLFTVATRINYPDTLPFERYYTADPADPDLMLESSPPLPSELDASNDPSMAEFEADVAESPETELEPASEADAQDLRLLLEELSSANQTKPNN